MNPPNINAENLPLEPGYRWVDIANESPHQEAEFCDNFGWCPMPTKLGYEAIWSYRIKVDAPEPDPATKSDAPNWRAIADDLASALEGLDALCRSEEDPEAPVTRPEWLRRPWKRYHRACAMDMSDRRRDEAKDEKGPQVNPREDQKLKLRQTISELDNSSEECLLACSDLRVLELEDMCAELRNALAHANVSDAMAEHGGCANFRNKRREFDDLTARAGRLLFRPACSATPEGGSRESR